MSRPRLGFLGLGWIGCHRLRGVCERGLADVVAIADPAAEARQRALALAPGARVAADLEGLLDQGVDGVVIATPSARHAGEARLALARGAAVFCQKPLARTHAETMALLDAARRADRLLGVDLCYRRTTAISRVSEVVRSGVIGDVYAAELIFHNAYGPDKAWFYDISQAGGGCLIDLGTHLIDLALWLAASPVRDVESRLFAAGRRLELPAAVPEDFAKVRLDFDNGATATATCSWNLPAGRDAVIEGQWYGTGGGVRFSNCQGSFFDFAAERYEGTGIVTLAEPPDDWGPRTIVDWVERLAGGARYEPAIEACAEVARVIDVAYGRASTADSSAQWKGGTAAANPHR